jgi:hypothetical protein
VVRDIESAVMAKLGIQIDHRKVSVAQIQSNVKRETGRLKFSDVSISLNGSRAEATVRLARNGSSYMGTSSGLSSSNGQMRSIATATLQAIEDSGCIDGTLMIEDLTTNVTLANKAVVVILVNLVTDRGEEYLTGSAIVKQDLWKAVVNASLDAVNRRTTLICDD